MKHVIKVTFTDETEIFRTFFGDADDVIRHYQKVNELAVVSGMPQAERIDFIESPLLESFSAYVYLFMDLGDGFLR